MFSCFEEQPDSRWNAFRCVAESQVHPLKVNGHGRSSGCLNSAERLLVKEYLNQSQVTREELPKRGYVSEEIRVFFRILLALGLLDSGK